MRKNKSADSTLSKKKQLKTYLVLFWDNAATRGKNQAKHESTNHCKFLCAERHADTYFAPDC